ncbi:hydrogenase 3 maturation endopeptidase HyCI [Candidatus Bathyarchaeota archaeon]|nr:hydrogenase 3 maturation endopeptidase HyCI [Candidatus Bathyarchaeota archaeon]
MASTHNSVREELDKWFSGARKVVIAGIGNPVRMDDFAGVKIAQNLQGKVSEKVHLIECETVPESFIQQIVDFDPSHILLIDAALLGLKPGSSRIVEPAQVAAYAAYSTHTLPLRIFCEYLAKTTKAKIALLLIEPKETDFGEGLSSEVGASTQQITSILLDILGALT